MAKIRVLLADDAVVVRRMVSDVLCKDPQLDVVGTAPNGKLALAKIPQVNPDVLVMDVEMPEMDGLQTLAALRKTYPTLPVIMFSTLTQRGAAATLDALALGANDYVAKPANVGSVAEAQKRIRDELIPKIKLFCEKSVNRGVIPPVVRAKTAVEDAGSAKLPLRGNLPRRVDLVAIGVSTGGPNALAAVLPTFPADFPVPLVIVQHMPPVFTKLLAERLSSQSALKVTEAAEGTRLEPGRGYIAPGDYHMIVRVTRDGFKLGLNQDPPENSCRPAVDVLFRSVAETFRGGVLAVVLTGMGQDGLRGCESITEAGGQVFVQDEASSVVWGMPGYVARAGLAEKILPINQIGPEIVRRVRANRLAAIPA